MNVRGMREKNARNVPAFSAHTTKKHLKEENFDEAPLPKKSDSKCAHVETGYMEKRERESVAYIK